MTDNTVECTTAVHICTFLEIRVTHSDDNIATVTANSGAVVNGSFKTLYFSLQTIQI